MSSPRVLNVYKGGIPPGAAYIGRSGKWGNPFVIGKDGNRAEVIAKYRAWLLAHPEFWDSFIANAVAAGHRVICCTMRYEEIEGEEVKKALTGVGGK